VKPRYYYFKKSNT